MKIKTNNVPADCDYLTNGKEYEVIDHNKFRVAIKCDDGDIIDLLLEKCRHLNGESWEIVSE